ncbi:hypothetical protein FKG94_00175 [Exilibacterium tricleocarpae]|uniref:SMP-30/Gluconolactonase/LRE-like region domain-containing protein n=1 Tax=Exilibacterium tricleocarpae TaxID=2591008 RepID=A0A545UBF6_9GAMM|nr:hypothetical protein [Exilibacterium tricleocarpae]TQV86798.1 hypothetical protein FKG94_00175 [Exilibacterium tricleocarpae]
MFIPKSFAAAICFLFTAATCAGAKNDLPLAVLTFDGIHAVDDGTIYAAAGFGGSRIYRISDSGVVTTFADGFQGPIDITQTADGSLYVTNYSAAKVSKISPAGEVSDFATVLEGPSGITSDTEGNLYVAHFGVGGSGGDTILKIDSKGNTLVFSAGVYLNAPVGITIDGDKNLYVANTSDGAVVKIDQHGNQLLITALPAASGFAIGHLEYSKNRIYATNIGEGTLHMIRPSGNSRILKASRRVQSPNGITYNAVSGNIMVAEAFGPVSKLVGVRVQSRARDW